MTKARENSDYTGLQGDLALKSPVASPVFTGNVGINETSPAANLHLGASSPHIDIGPSGANRGKIGFNSNNIYIGSTSGAGEIHFKNNISSNDAPNSSGDTKMIIADSAVIIGNGITLGNGTTYAAANTLSDYETGSWTPAFGRNGGTQPTPTYGEQVGSYTKVGDMVFLTGDMYISAISIPDNGNLVITGMPFTKGSGHNPTGSFTFDGFNFGRARSQLVHLDGTKLGFLGQAASTGAGSWGWEELSGLGGGESLRFAITYQV